MGCVLDHLPPTVCLQMAHHQLITPPALTLMRKRDLYRNFIILRDVYGLCESSQAISRAQAPKGPLSVTRKVYIRRREWLTHTGMKLPANRARIAVKYLHSLRIKASRRSTTRQLVERWRLSNFWRNGDRVAAVRRMCLQILRQFCCVKRNYRKFMTFTSSLGTNCQRARCKANK